MLDAHHKPVGEDLQLAGKSTYWFSRSSWKEDSDGGLVVVEEGADVAGHQGGL